ncbi:S-geranylgeranyl-glutathione receptor P2RY8-like [Lampetra fluviatilis]
MASEAVLRYANTSTNASNDHKCITLTDNSTLQWLQGDSSQIVQPIIYIIVIIVSLPVNAAALWFLVNPTVNVKRTPSTVFTKNLAAVDLLYLLFLPLAIAYNFNGNDWRFGTVLCHVVVSLTYLNAHCSIFLLTCISVDRYLALVHPVKSRPWRTPRYAAALSAVMWALMVLSIVPAVTVQLVTCVKGPNFGPVTTCLDVFTKQDGLFLAKYSLGFFFLAFLVPFAVTAFCYVAIVLSLRRRTREGAHLRVEMRKSIFLCATVLTAFCLCFVPTNATLFTHVLRILLKGNTSLYKVYKICLALASLNTCLDSFVYYTISKPFRLKVRGLLCCCVTAKEPLGDDDKSEKGTSS